LSGTSVRRAETGCHGHTGHVWRTFGLDPEGTRFNDQNYRLSSVWFNTRKCIVNESTRFSVIQESRERRSWVAVAPIHAEGHATVKTMPVSTRTGETITGLRVALRVML
jgi:hypothetical protein